MVDITKVTDNKELIELFKQRDEIENKIREIDEMALIRYELEHLKTPHEENCKTE